MAFLGLRKWPVPVVKTLWPFLTAGGITMYLVYGAQESSIRSAEWAKDARNPYAAKIASEARH